MKIYEKFKKPYYGSMVHPLLNGNIISPTKAVDNLDKVNKKKEASKDLNKDLTMVKQQGLTNILIGEDVKEVLLHE